MLLVAEPWLASMSPVEQEVGVDMLMQRMKSLSERSEEFSQEEKTKRFEHVENQSVELSPGLEPLTQVKADIGHFVDDPTFLYQDFARRGEVSDIPTFRVQVSSCVYCLNLKSFCLGRNSVVPAKWIYTQKAFCCYMFCTSCKLKYLFKVTNACMLWKKFFLLFMHGVSVKIFQGNV